MTTEELNPAKIRFNCRRGMGELEDVLYPFFDNHFEALTPEEQQMFSSLLASEDVELWAWLVTKQEVPPTRFETIVNKIKDAA